MNSSVYIPIWKRKPNKFVEYREIRFTCGQYHGTKRIAVFEDKSGKIREELAQVIWMKNIELNSNRVFIFIPNMI